MSVEEKWERSSWSWEEDKAFEKAIATYPEDLEDRWEKIAGDVGGKSIEEVKHHYELLIEDINQIESGRVPLPSYNSSSEDSEEGIRKKAQSSNAAPESNHGTKASRSDQERRKGIAWTEDEHRLFLLGLEKYGKGDWRSISRNFVVTRTPTQVASHAQKYFIRLNSMNKDRRRSSIHDITSVNAGDQSSTQGPITGQTNAAAGSGPGPGPSSCVKSEKQGAQPPGVVGLYGGAGAPSIGQPAVGTPVNLARPPPHMAYGAPMGMAPITYPMPHTSAHR